MGRIKRAALLAQQGLCGSIAPLFRRQGSERVVMTLLVRDGVDLAAATIEHALSMGVDFIVATDNGSVDGTADVLAAYQSAGVLELHHEPTHDYEQGRWVTAMARRAARVHGASWIVNSDIDEFLWAQPGWEGRRLGELLGAVAPRHGLVGLSEVRLVEDATRSGAWPERVVRRSQRGGTLTTWGFDFWKVCHRADPYVRVTVGNHLVYGPLVGGLSPERPLAIVHLPHRSYAQYERKVRSGGSAFAANTRLRPGVGVYLRREYEVLKEGRLAESYARHLEAGVPGDEARVWTGLRDHLHALVPRAVRPDLLTAALGADVVLR